MVWFIVLYIYTAITFGVVISYDFMPFKDIWEVLLLIVLSILWILILPLTIWFILTDGRKEKS